MPISMDIIEVIRSRQSCRAYSGEKIEYDKLRLIVEAGRLSQSARNSQPWTLVLAFSTEAVESVGKCTRANGRNGFSEKCSAFIVVVEEENEAAFGGLPHRYFAEMDIGMCVMSMCLEAESIGVSCCVLGAFDEDDLKAVCGIDKSKSIKLVVALGYSECGDPHREKSRKSYDEAVIEI